MKLLALAVLLWAAMFSCQAAGHHAVSLHWAASTTPNVSYNVYREPQGSTTFSLLNPGGFDGTTFNDTSVLPNHTYSYYVTAFDGTTESAPSNTFTVTVP